MRRLYEEFPGGRVGVGLFLLRVVIGSVTMIQGGVYLLGTLLSFTESVVGVLSILSGVALILGFRTPVFSAIVGIETLGVAVGWLPSLAPRLFSSILPAFPAIVISAAIALLGPGAYSVDARAFGMREIVIPLRAPSSGN